MIRNCCQSSGWARAPFISIPDCEAKSCAHQSQVCKVTVNGVRKWQPRYKQGPVQDFSGNACLFDSRMSQLHFTLRCCCILFCRKIYKSQLPESSEFFEAEICTYLFRNQIVQVITLVRISIYSRAVDSFQFIMNSVTETGVRNSGAADGWRRFYLEFIIKPRICTSNASSSLFRPALISIDQMDLVTPDCFKQPSEGWL